MAFKKGQSGNPGGRPKEEGEVRELARSYTVEAIQKLVTLMRSAEEEKVQALAAIAILDRGHGRPAQAVEVSGKDGGPLIVNLVKYA